MHDYDTKYIVCMAATAVEWRRDELSRAHLPALPALPPLEPGVREDAKDDVAAADGVAGKVLTAERIPCSM